MDSQGPGKVPSCSLELEVLGEQPTQASATDKAMGPREVVGPMAAYLSHRGSVWHPRLWLLELQVSEDQ